MKFVYFIFMLYDYLKCVHKKRLFEISNLMKSDNEITLFGALLYLLKNEEINFYEFMSEFMWHMKWGSFN